MVLGLPVSVILLDCIAAATIKAHSTGFVKSAFLIIIAYWSFL